MSDKKWKLVKVVNGLSIVEFDNEYYMEIRNKDTEKWCRKCDLIGTYDASRCYVFVKNNRKCPAQHTEENNHSYFIKGGV